MQVSDMKAYCTAYVSQPVIRKIKEKFTDKIEALSILREALPRYLTVPSNDKLLTAWVYLKVYCSQSIPLDEIALIFKDKNIGTVEAIAKIKRLRRIEQSIKRELAKVELVSDPLVFSKKYEYGVSILKRLSKLK
jgi:hypothetical protein